MNWILIILGLLIVLFFFKNLKHHLVRKSITFTLAIIVFFVLMMFASSYLDLGSFFSKESVFAKTGAAVVDTVSDNVDTSSVSNFLSDSLSSLQNVSSGSSPKKSEETGFIRIK